MAYLDSPKNRALWTKELNDLKKRKAERKKGEDKVFEENTKEAAADRTFSNSLAGAYRIRTSYKELLREEQQSILARKNKDITLHKETQKSMDFDDLSVSNNGRK